MKQKSTSRCISDSSSSSIWCSFLFYSSVRFFLTYVSISYYLWFPPIRISQFSYISQFGVFCSIVGYAQFPINMFPWGIACFPNIIVFIAMLSSLFMWKYCLSSWFRWQWNLICFPMSLYAALPLWRFLFVQYLWGGNHVKFAVYCTYIIPYMYIVILFCSCWKYTPNRNTYKRSDFLYTYVVIFTIIWCSKDEV